MKKAVVTLLALTTFGATLTAPFMAKAFEVNIGGHRFSDSYGYRSNNSYLVLYRKHRGESWKVKDNYGTRFEAEYALRRLQDKGYFAYIKKR